jgi:hypothetical protein
LCVCVCVCVCVFCFFSSFPYFGSKFLVGFWVGNCMFIGHMGEGKVGV